MGGIHLARQAQGGPGFVYILLMEGDEGLAQGVARLLAHQLDVSYDDLRQGAGDTQAVPADGHGIVANTLQRHVQAEDRRHEAKVLGHREMPNDEGVAGSIQGPGLPVHDPILEDHLSSQFRVVCGQGLDRITDLAFHTVRDLPDLRSNGLKVRLEALFVV
jgi:hypothetical protein